MKKISFNSLFPLTLNFLSFNIGFIEIKIILISQTEKVATLNLPAPIVLNFKC